jgi:hypothetical protein
MKFGSPHGRCESTYSLTNVCTTGTPCMPTSCALFLASTASSMDYFITITMHQGQKPETDCGGVILSLSVFVVNYSILAFKWKGFYT